MYEGRDSLGSTTRFEWHELIHALETIVDYYESLNRVSTFFQVDRWRKEAARLSNESLDILELGCGPGGLTTELRGKSIICLDPSSEMLRICRDRAAGHVGFGVGVGEHLPLKSESFDAIFCSFSFRDFRDRKHCLSEIYRALRTGGILIILDIAKHTDSIRSKLIYMHLRFCVPLIARVIVPRRIRRELKRDPYVLLSRTYRDFETAEELKTMMEKVGFACLQAHDLSFGGAMILMGTKYSQDQDESSCDVRIRA